MSAPLAYLNGRFLPFTEAVLPLHDAGFVSGATIVDNARTFRHKLFRWPDHLARFRRDCAACFVPLTATDEHLTATAEELVAHNTALLTPGSELQLVTFATPGPLGFYLGEANNGPPTIGMVTYPLPFARYRRFFTEGVSLAVAGTQSSDPGDLLPPRIKHRSRLFWHIADKTLNDPTSRYHAPGAVPVVLDHAGTADTAIACVLAVVDDTVIYPPADRVQDSISAKVVADLCATIGLKHRTEPLDFRQICEPSESNGKDTAPLNPSELLLAGTGFCIAGVKRFARAEHVRDYSWPGPVLNRLLTAWSDLVGVSIAKQFTG
ncbi:branched-chain amino acid aminotransferase : Aminotransferase class IV OS=Planctomyces brasiliensis (strain ATCC 49424 / DSM 5305 / JCM 21570 / NBRC 103401 / IFAM 1448) GN=Plabr_3516 PE=3 SV=1: Aminotran_4 [Gemmata massiliana]|uniref:Branched-chain amino acid aminotransferase n=1 Tax=Gemmata massiliana TaxID=1210884 RepID=A0A6P2DMB7_9BACT|nr:aminotransferase class IV [Gemmata massiliana]VTS03280.1 branched-chain amino acid aminotransferase : Aminotransferase class IV OS=Planctomyces brasiliensis (strain ATCC 49424 / DSM 5305 / JCM 21570 / NBRC 103401 / IFAM 1448) GN=Plabr_3516 PE=3 SV=1: Aminotran_4 [Gemmata massiliana]